MSEENKNKTESIEQSETTSTSTPSTEDFDVIFASKTDDGTIVTTSAESFTHRQLSIALSVYDPKNDNYSVYLNEGVTPSKTLSVEEIDDGISYDAQEHSRGGMQHRVPPGETSVEVDDVPEYQGTETEGDEYHLHAVGYPDVREPAEHRRHEYQHHHHDGFEQLEGDAADCGIVIHEKERGDAACGKQRAQAEYHLRESVQTVIFHWSYP